MRSLRISIFLAIFITIIGAISYFIKFNNGWSDSDESWGNFAVYISLFINVSTLLILGAISLNTFRTTDNFNELHTTPLLDLSLESLDNTNGHQVLNIPDSWFIINCTDAVARNVTLKFWIGDIQSIRIACYAILGKSKLALPWLRYASRIQIHYSDAFTGRYFVLDYQNLRGDPVRITQEEFQAVMSEHYVNSGNLLLNFESICFKKVGALTLREYVSEFFDVNGLRK